MLMSDNKPFSSGRWKDIPIPFSTEDITEFTEEEREKERRSLERILRERGILKNDERIADFEVDQLKI